MILGGGYIAADLGYYFESFDTDVTLIEMMDSLVPREDADVAETFTEIASKRHDVYTGYRASAVTESNGEITVTAETEDSEAQSASGNRTQSDDGSEIEVEGDELLVALGRQPNTESIDLDATTVETTDERFIETDEQLRTSVENVWAMGRHRQQQYVQTLRGLRGRSRDR